jgi:hypothetical protein
MTRKGPDRSVRAERSLHRIIKLLMAWMERSDAPVHSPRPGELFSAAFQFLSAYSASICSAVHALAHYRRSYFQFRDFPSVIHSIACFTRAARVSSRLASPIHSL